MNNYKYILNTVGILFGDSFWLHSVVPKITEGEKSLLLCTKFNYPIFEFFKEYLYGWENIDIRKTKYKDRSMNLYHYDKIHKKVTKSYTKILKLLDYPSENQDKNWECLPLNQRFKKIYGTPDKFFNLKKPIISNLKLKIPYICFHPYTCEKWKNFDSLFKIKPIIKGYSIGLKYERIILGTIPFRTTKIADLIYLLQHSRGLIGVNSSVCLLANILGIQTLMITFNKQDIINPIEHWKVPYIKILYKPTKREIVKEAKQFFGQGLIK